MSKILISGCGISWSGQHRPTWVNVLKICGADIDDHGGPAISNQTILNRMIEAVLDNDYDQAVCQLTGTGKLDVEINSDARREVMRSDSIRNFTHRGVWPSSSSEEHESKRMYYKYLHSPTAEQKDIIFKWSLLDRLCADKGTILHTVMGYKLDWLTGRHTLIRTDHDYSIYADYTQGEHYQHHDHSVGEKNTVPNKHFQIHLAKKINNEMLKLPIQDRLEKFRD